MNPRFKFSIVALAILVTIALVSVSILTPRSVSAAQVVVNGGFETGSLSPWTQTAGSATVVNSNARSGTYALRVGTASGSAAEQNLTGLTPSTVYALVGYAKVTSGDSVAIGVKNFGGTQIAYAVTTTSYSIVSFNFTTGASNTTATIFCYKNSGSGYDYCDDFTVTGGSGPTPTNTPIPPTATKTNTPVPPTATNTPVPATPTRTNTPVPPTATRTNTPVPPTATNMPPSGGNLVGNPGLETGSLSPWVQTAGLASVVNSNARSGTYALRVGTASGSSAEQYLSGLSVNTTYSLVGYAKISSGDSVSIGVKDFGGTQIAWAVTTTSYSQVAFNFTTSAGYTTATIFCYKISGSGYDYCDDFSVTGPGGGPTPTNTPVGPTPTNTPSGNPTPIGIPGTWNLVFRDEFNGASLNLSDWEPNWLGASNTTITAPVNTAENAAYDPARVSVSGGYLNLSAISSSVTVGGKTYPYRSGMIQTNGPYGGTPMHQFVYGAFEARIYSPASGSSIANWPAWWTDGQSWPTDGEMDIFEGLGGSASYHFHSDTTGAGATVSGNYTGWHTYASEWASGIVKFYYDGVLVGTLNSGITSSPMYLILNYAVEGCCAGPTVIPATMQVDYVRVWQH